MTLRDDCVLYPLIDRSHPNGMVFSITVLGKISKDEAQIRRRYGDIPNRSDADVFKVRILLVWYQFQPKVD